MCLWGPVRRRMAPRRRHALFPISKYSLETYPKRKNSTLEFNPRGVRPGPSRLRPTRFPKPRLPRMDKSGTHPGGHALQGCQPAPHSLSPARLSSSVGTNSPRRITPSRSGLDRVHPVRLSQDACALISLGGPRTMCTFGSHGPLRSHAPRYIAGPVSGIRSLSRTLRSPTRGSQRVGLSTP